MSSFANSVDPGATAHPLREAAEKVKRAAAHLEALHAAIRQFNDSEPKPYRLVPEVDQASSRYLLRIRIERDPPPQWSLIAGDFIQNLRASLDYLVWQLVLDNDHRPGRGNAFPIFDEEPPRNPNNRHRQRWKASLRGVGPEAVEFIEALQPFNAPHGPDRHLLTALRELSNQDKHRSLMPAFSAIQREPGLADVTVVGVHDVRAPIEGGKLLAGRALGDGDLVLEAPIEILGPDPMVEIEGRLPLDVAFGRSLVPLEGLRQMCDAVAETLAAARHLFG